MKIQPDMTPYGYSILLLASELIDKDCPKARSGGASLAAVPRPRGPARNNRRQVEGCRATLCEGGANHVVKRHETEDWQMQPQNRRVPNRISALQRRRREAAA